MARVIGWWTTWPLRGMLGRERARRKKSGFSRCTFASSFPRTPGRLRHPTHSTTCACSGMHFGTNSKMRKSARGSWC
eukprot:1521860-Pleurochrysis_carterae.AAC.4